MNVQKEARKDAREYARAQMFYGDGAGNRRKIIETVVASKVEKSPEYQRVFTRELARQDMGEHAMKAQKERRRKDLVRSVNKNTKAAATGQYTGINMAVIVIGGVAYYMHKNGYDKRVWNATKRKYESVKVRFAKSTDATVHRIDEAVHKMTHHHPSGPSAHHNP